MHKFYLIQQIKMAEKGKEFTAYMPSVATAEVTQLTNTNLFSFSFDAVETFLKDNITDPRSRHKANWIHASMPNINSMSFEGYPFIILKININEDNKSFDEDVTQKNFQAFITIYSDQPSDIESISNEIGNQYRDETKLTDFDSRELTSSPINWTLDQKGKKALFREIQLNLRNRI